MPQAQLEPIQITAPVTDADRSILTPEAVSFLKELSRNFEERRQQLLAHRHERQQEIDRGAMPQFLPQTAWIRDSDWVAAPMAADLRDRRVEITGPVDRKMIINALNSGASVFMADFEDSNSPTWRNNLDGQFNLRDAVNGVISYVSPEGKRYELGERTAVLMVRPRGWHLNEKHFLVDGQPISAGLFDFGLFFFHNAKALMAKGSGPYFYLPKLESYLEARLWNDVFHFAQRELGIPRGTIRATVLIETILAAFEMDEIIYELREHSAGLNCGRWDYIFSFIKKFAGDTSVLLPDRGQVTMTTHFMRSYSKLCIKTCHRRQVSAMGGMSALIPIKSDPEANERAIAGVQADKEREASDGHDGTWVAHPGLVPVALEVFDRVMPQPNQISKQLPDYHTTAADLLQVPAGTITEAGLKQNVAVGLGYVEAWLRGIGCVPLFNLMEDAATAEISRAQLWQWVHHGAKITDGPNIGTPITAALVEQTIADELAATRPKVDANRFSAYERAAKLMRTLIESPTFPEFLTVPAYAEVLKEEKF